MPVNLYRRCRPTEHPVGVDTSPEGVGRKQDFIRVHFFYLVERMPLSEIIVKAQTYSTVVNLSQTLIVQFWRDIERHHPGLDTLHLNDEIVKAWKERLLTTPTLRGSLRSQDFYFTVIGTVRAFYRALQEWALQNPSWAEWAYPNPTRKRDIAGWTKPDTRGMRLSTNVFESGSLIYKHWSMCQSAIERSRQRFVLRP